MKRTLALLMTFMMIGLLLGPAGKASAKDIDEAPLIEITDISSIMNGEEETLHVKTEDVNGSKASITIIFHSNGNASISVVENGTCVKTIMK